MATSVTIKQIAAQAGVSETTVSRVLNQPELVNQQTVARVRSVMSALQYRPNALARSMRSHTTQIIGVVISNVLNPFFTTLVRGVEDAATGEGYAVIVCNTDEDPQKEREYLEMLVDRQADGIILAGTGSPDSYHDLVGDVPLVFIDRLPSPTDQQQYDTVTVDNAGGSAAAVEALIAQGAQRIKAIVSNVPTSGLERIQGFKRAMSQHHLAVAPTDIAVDDYLGQQSTHLAQQLLQQGDCDAIFCGNNLILMHVLRVLQSQQLTAIRLATFDNQDWFDFVATPIISVDQPAYAMGARAFTYLTERLAKPTRPLRHDVIAPTLVVR